MSAAIGGMLIGMVLGGIGVAVALQLIRDREYRRPMSDAQRRQAVARVVSMRPDDAVQKASVN